MRKKRRNPPIPKQKKLRKKDHSITPSAPYLLLSKAIDVACEIPLIKTACPVDFRESLPPEWGQFPHGKLSHSFSSYFRDDLKGDITYSDFLKITYPKGIGAPSTLPDRLVSYYDFAFHTSSTTIGDLTNPLAITILFCILIILRGLKKIILPRFSALGRKLGGNAHGSAWVSENEDRIVKFGEYVYRLCYHSSVSLFGICYFWNTTWWNKELGGTKTLWEGHPNQEIAPGMAWYYLVQCAYNVDALVSLFELSFCINLVNPMTYSSALEHDWKAVGCPNKKTSYVNGHSTSNLSTKPPLGPSLIWTPFFQITWSPTVRGDFREMMAHHIVTNMLIFGSSFYRFTRAGSMIFLVHDVSDVPIDLSKLANFVKWKTTTILCFITMVIMWVVARLIVFPFVIYRSVLFETLTYLVVKGNMDPALYFAYRGLFFFLLGSLVALHIIWFLILLRIGWTLVRKGETHDYSEHKQGERQLKKMN